MPQVFLIFLLLLQTMVASGLLSGYAFKPKNLGSNLGSDLVQPKFGPHTSIFTTNRPPARAKHRRSLTYTNSSQPPRAITSPGELVQIFTNQIPPTTPPSSTRPSFALRAHLFSLPFVRAVHAASHNVSPRT